MIRPSTVVKGSDDQFLLASTTLFLNARSHLHASESAVYTALFLGVNHDFLKECVRPLIGWSVCRLVRPFVGPSNRNSYARRAVMSR